MKKLGIIVGRFQVPELTSGHKYLIGEAIRRSDKVIIFVGTTKNGVPSSRSPLPFEAVKNSIMEDKDIEPFILGIYSIEDVGNFPIWVRNLDNLISSLYKLGLVSRDYEPTLYGSRDSMIPGYIENNGTYKAEFIPPPTNPTIRTVSGTEFRKKFKDEYHPQLDYNDRCLLIWYSENYLSSEKPENP